jgi:hypothetical protein
MVPPAPPRFSTTMVWPSAFSSAGWIKRAIVSSTPPGGNPTSMVTGRLG